MWKKKKHPQNWNNKKFPSMMSEDKWTNLQMAIYFLEHEHEIIHKPTNIIHYCHDPTCGNMIYFPF